MSISTVTVNINNEPYNVQGEYTSDLTAQLYLFSLQPFFEVLNLGIPPLDEDNPQAIEDAIRGVDPHVNQHYDEQFKDKLLELLYWAKNGVPDPSTGKLYFFTAEMAAAVDQLIKTLTAAGATINPGVITRDGTVFTAEGTLLISVDNVVNWKNLVASSSVIADILVFAQDSATILNRSMQSLIELVYIKTGNDIVTDNLDALESALSTTKTTIETLTKLQELHNKIETTQAGLWVRETLKDLKTFFSGPQLITIVEIERARAFTGVAASLYSPSVMRERETDRLDPLDSREVTILSYRPAVTGSMYPATSFMEGRFASSRLEGVADAFFIPLDPTVPPESIDAKDRALFLALRDELERQVKALSATTPKLPGQIEDDGSLLGQVRKVLENINAAIEAAGGEVLEENVTLALRMWILDNEQLNEPSALKIPDQKRAISSVISHQP